MIMNIFVHEEDGYKILSSMYIRVMNLAAKWDLGFVPCIVSIQ